MIRIICNGPLRYDWMRRYRLFHPLIEYLQEISNKVPHLNAKQQGKLFEDFSLILNDLIIDGTWKKTGNDRLLLGDTNLLKTMAHLTMGRYVDFLDVGCSDGITTLNLVQKFKTELAIAAKATLFDRNFSVTRQKLLGIYVYSTNYGKPFFVRMWKLGLVLEELKCKEAIIFNPVVRLLVPLIKKKLNSIEDNEKEIISLINPAILETPELSFVEGDLFCMQETFINSFDVIRAGNILNKGYFPCAQILLAVNHLKEYLRDGGLLLISRSLARGNGEIETGTIWQKINGKLVVLTDFGGGSELRQIISEHALSEPACHK